MKIARLFGLVLVSILATSLMVASLAAAEPLISPVGATVKAESGEAELANASVKVNCKKSSSTGEVTSPHLIGKTVVTFTECEGKEAGEKCPIMSTNTSSTNTIITNTLHGILGLGTLTSGGTVPAVLYLPGKGVTFVTLLGKCVNKAETSAVSGQVAGVANPIGSPNAKGTLNFEVIGGKQQINKFASSLGGELSPELVAFGLTSTQSQNNKVEFNEAVEIT